MKRIIAALVILATVLSFAACSIGKELTPEERASSVAAQESKHEEKASKAEAAIVDGKAKLLEKIGKSKKNKQLVVINETDSFTEYRVFSFDRNGFADTVKKYVFYTSNQYGLMKTVGDSGRDRLVDHDDDLRLLTYKRSIEEDDTYDALYDVYKNLKWTIVE